MTPDIISDREAKRMIEELQEWAASKWGETEYKYFARAHNYNYRQKQFRVAIGQDIEVSKAVYDANFETGEKNDRDAFYGRSKLDFYTTYHKKMITPGWREKLAELVQVTP